MITLLNTFNRTSADPHSIAITSATAGRDIVLVVSSAAAVTTPAGWSLVTSRVGSMGDYIFRLPGASNTGGTINVSLDLTAARGLSAVAFEAPINTTGQYASLVAMAASTSTTRGTDGHTFAAKNSVVAIYTFNSTAGTPTITPSSFSDGFTLLADTGWSNSGAGGNEAARVIIAKGSNIGFTAAGVTMTTSAALTGVGNISGGFYAFDELNETPPSTSPIVVENLLTGHNKTNFEFATNQWTRPAYADGFTFNAGETVNFKVNSPENFTVEIFRLGYYAGAGARRVTTVNGTAQTQPAATVNSTTLEGDAANWTTNASWAIPTTAVSGLYLALVRSATAGNFWRTPFVVRNDSRAADIIVKTSDTTWQAYNAWGGRSLYGSTTNVSSDAERSFAVRYDRPITTELDRTQSSWENAEWPLIQFLERNGYNVKYVSCLDLERDPTILNSAKVVISSGHDEYWSDNMWNAHVNARTAGAHLIFMSGNEAFWRVRFTDNRKRMVCYKDTKSGVQTDPVTPTGTWQDTRAFNSPIRRAPASLTGSRFIANGIREDALKVPFEFKNSPFWRNTSVASLTTGQEASYAGILGFEWNGYFPSENEIPKKHITLSSTTVALTNQMSDINGNLYNLSGSPTHKIVLYKASSGSMVLGLGTVQWAWGLGPIRNRSANLGVYNDIKQATYNILIDMGVTPETKESVITTTTAQTYDFPVVVPVLRFYLNGNWIDITGSTPGEITPA